ncbi:MAG: ABC transporter substrate-binding protein [Candidatus Hermodarchaeota archaeon]
MKRKWNFMGKRYFWITLILLVVCSCSTFSILPSRAQASEPILKMTIIARLKWTQYPQLIVNELHKIGIDARLLNVGWDVLIPRMFDSPSHLDYAGGGFDLGCLPWSGSIVPSNLYEFFHSSNESPQGVNYYPVINQTLDGILEFVMNTTDFDERKEYIKQALEMIVWEIHPVTGIYQHENLVYMRDNVKGYSCDLRVPGALGVAEMYFEDGRSHGHGEVNEFIMAGTRKPNKYNDIIENDWYNQLAIAQLNHELVERNPDYNFVPVLLTQLPYPVAVTNNHTELESSVDPNFATVWEIELRDDVYWHEGYGYTMTTHEDILRVDADDVVFTFGLILDDNEPSPCAVRSKWQRLLGNDTSLAVIKKDRYHVQFHLQAVEAELMAYFEQYLMPQHILTLGMIRADGTVAPTDYADWNTDDWNLGRRTGGHTGPAVIGNGPYILWPGEDLNEQTVTETKNPYWHLTAEPSYSNIFDKFIYKWITSKDTALTALEQAKIDLMDPRFHADKDYPDMKNKSGIAVLKRLDWGYQTLGYNILHGAGGKLANKWVRLAIAHMVPYQDIVKYLLGGLGQANFAPFPKQSPFWPIDLRPIEYNQTKALDYLEKAGYDVTPFRTSTTETSLNPVSWSPDLLSFISIVVVGGITVVLISDTVKALIYRYQKRKNR